MDGNRNDFQNQGSEHELQLGDTDCAAQSGAVGTDNEFVSVPVDPRLLKLVDAWPMLSEGVRDAIAKLVPDELNADGVTAALANETVAR